VFCAYLARSRIYPAWRPGRLATRQVLLTSSAPAASSAISPARAAHPDSASVHRAAQCAGGRSVARAARDWLAVLVLNQLLFSSCSS
jgi:hypothetical protein